MSSQTRANDTSFAASGVIILFVTSLPGSLERGAGMPGLMIALVLIGLGYEPYPLGEQIRLTWGVLVGSKVMFRRSLRSNTLHGLSVSRCYQVEKGW